MARREPAGTDDGSRVSARLPASAPALIGAIACLAPLGPSPELRAQPAAPEPVHVSPPSATPEDGERREISGFTVLYTRTIADQPAEADVLQAEVTLGRVADGYVAPREGVPSVVIRLSDVPSLEERRFYDSALPHLAPAVVRRMQELGLIGIYVEPDPEQLAVVEGRIVDLRPPGETTLRLLITTGIVSDVRTVGMGDFIPEADRVNNARHDRIRRRSPVGPLTGEEDARRPTTEVLKRDLIDEYVFRLNRHPGRRVDVAVAATGDEPASVTLDYIVSENRPWFLYAQAANNGTDETGNWRERFGFVHNQLTNNDDVFYIDYLTSNFDELNALTISYESPAFDSDTVRWRAYGSWSEYTASDVGQPDADFDGRGWGAGGELVWNFLQDRDFFADVVGGARWQNIRVDNELAEIEGEDDFLLPYFGLRLERVRESERLLGSFIFEGNLPGAADTNQAELSDLGRLDVDESWLTLQYDALYSFFLEPLFEPDLAKGTSLAHEIYLNIRGQVTAAEARLVPNFEDVVGGMYSVRGYPEAIAAGDTTVVVTAEYRYHVPRGFTPDVRPGELFGRPFRFTPQYRYGPTDWDLILRGFVDFGRAINNDRLSFEVDQTLVGAGIGVELAISRNVNVRLDWGFALDGLDDGAGGTLVDSGDNELHFILTLVF